MQLSRRDFVKFLGLSAFSLAACNQIPEIKKQNIFSLKAFSFKPLDRSKEDDLILPEGFEYKILKSWGDEIAPGVDFGFNNDFTCFFGLDSNHALLWVNHESIDPKLIPKISEQKKNVGGSIIALEKIQGEWKVSQDQALISKYNRRYDANSLFLMQGPVNKLYPQVKGTLANCSGGKTPWNTVLSCEENYDHFTDIYGWKDINLEHYGWVIEIDPYNPEFKACKHSALGRFAHENTAITLSKNNKVIVYMGDDIPDGHIYKFISTAKFSNFASKEKNSSLLDSGTLYAAQLDGKANGKWLKLDISNPQLAKYFNSQAELLINTRKAAEILGATPMARPEDLEVSPDKSSIFVSLTQNVYRGDLHGSIMKIQEQDLEDEEFEYSTFLFGGRDIGLSCPDNLVFDDMDNLWVTTDIKGKYLNTPIYSHLGHNSLFVIPTKGANAGKAMRFASAPQGAELTGPSFSDDFKTLFLSVQHPGEDLSSSWPPDSRYKYPRPSVVAIKLD